MPKRYHFGRAPHEEAQASRILGEEFGQGEDIPIQATELQGLVLRAILRGAARDKPRIASWLMTRLHDLAILERRSPWDAKSKTAYRTVCDEVTRAKNDNVMLAKSQQAFLERLVSMTPKAREKAECDRDYAVLLLQLERWSLDALKGAQGMACRISLCRTVA